MAVQSMEHQRGLEQERMRTLSLALEGVHLAIAASGAAPVTNLGTVQATFKRFLDDLLQVGEPAKPEAKMSLAKLKFTYGSRWPDHTDELREEDRDKVSTSK